MGDFIKDAYLSPSSFTIAINGANVDRPSANTLARFSERNYCYSESGGPAVKYSAASQPSASAGKVGRREAVSVFGEKSEKREEEEGRKERVSNPFDKLRRRVIIVDVKSSKVHTCLFGISWEFNKNRISNEEER